MNQFLKRVSLFSFFLLISFLAFEYSLRQIPTIFSFKNKLVLENENKIKTIIIGSSVANHGIDPNILADSCFNFAMGGQSIRYNAAFLEKYIDNLPNLKNVIWGVGFFMLWYDEYGNKHPNVTYYDLYMDIRFDRNILRQSELISVGNGSFNKWMSYYIFHNNSITCDSLGLDNSFDSQYRNSNRNEWILNMKKDAQLQTQITHSLKAEEFYSFNVRRMEDIVELCHEKNINLYFIVLPTNRRFYESVNTDRIRDIIGTLNSIAKGNENVYVLNYFTDRRFEDCDFFDGHHLSSDIGAKKFTKILKNDINL